MRRERTIPRTLREALLPAFALSLLLPILARAKNIESSSFVERTNNLSGGGRWTSATSFTEIGEADFVGRSSETSANFAERAGQAGQRPVPSRITDLAVTATSSSTVSLRWTAPYADVERSTGAAAKYLIRYSLAGEIGADADFKNAIAYSQSFVPKNPGETEVRTLENLTANTIHAIAIESLNEHDVRSERSASSTAATLSPPPIADSVYEIARGVAEAPDASLFVVGTSSQASANYDILLARYDSSLALVSSRTLNGSAGSGNDEAFAVALDTAGVAYAFGYSQEPGPVTKNWLASFDASLNVISSRTLDRTDTTAFGHVLLGGAGELILTGNVVNGTDTDVWLAKYDRALNLLSSATFNTGLSPSAAVGASADEDSLGNIFVAGSVPPGAGAPGDIWAGKFDSNLVLIASAPRAGAGGAADTALSVAVGPNGDVFLGGSIDNGGLNLQAWLARYDSSLALKQETTIDGGGASGTDAVRAMGIGNGGNVVLAGTLNEAAGGSNLWRAEYNRVLLLLSSATLDGGSTGKAYAVSVDTPANAAYFAGIARAADDDVFLSSFPVAPPPSACSGLTSLQNGPWSLASTWFPPFVPSACNAVTVSAGTKVTVDITTATVSTLTVAGTLYASRVANSSLTIVAGDVSVSPGGHLDYGKPGDAIPPGVRSQLVLAKGPAPAAYGLSVLNGGNFTVKGATKTPWGYALSGIPAGATSLAISASSATGWAAGDRILIGPTQGSGTSSAEERTLTAVAGSDPLTLSWSGALAAARVAAATAPVYVANLTRNVLVRSSGTDTSADTAYILGMAGSATSFLLENGEFAHLGGAAGSVPGVRIADSSLASVSSSVFRQGWTGLAVLDASSVTIQGAVAYGNADIGVRISLGDKNACRDVLSAGNGTYGFSLENAPQNSLWGGAAFSNANAGILSASKQTTLRAFAAFSNGTQGLWSSAGDYLSVHAGRFYNNGGPGLLSAKDHVRLSDNLIFANGSQGLSLAGQSVRAAGNRIYGNAGQGLYASSPSDVLFADGEIGYDANGAPRPNGVRQVDVADASNPVDLRLKGVRLEPTGGIDVSDFDAADERLISYGQDYSTGTARFYGDHSIAGATWTFDYAQRLFPSTATPPANMEGPLHNLAVAQTYDAGAVSQLITFTFKDDNQWHVDGSSSGADLAVFTGIQTGLDIPAASPLFQANFSNVATPNAGDRLEFLLIGATPDQNAQKKLLIGPGASSRNFGRSKLQVAANGGLFLSGTAASPTLLDRLDSSSTYYSFVSSGAFTARLSSMTNMDAGGIQLSGSAGVEISTSAFDYLGVTAATASYITARDLASKATFYSNTFGLARDITGAPFPYNVRTEGSDSGLEWLFFQSTGPFEGETRDFDPGGRINWTNGASQPGTPAAMVLGVSSIAWTWGASADAASYNVYRASDGVTIVGAPASAAHTEVGLDTNTAYGVFIEPLHGLLGAGPLSAKATAYTLAAPPSATAASQVEGSSATIAWSLNTNPSGTIAQIDRSTDNLAFATVASGPVTSYADFGLLGCTTYYFRVRNINGDGVPTDYDGVLQFQTAGSTPLPPGNFTAESLGGQRIALAWSASPSSQTAQYRIYYDNGSGAVNYAGPFALLSSTVTNYTTPVLASSAAYTFGIRTTNACGVEEKNDSALAVAASSGTFAATRAAVRSPESGAHVTGNRVGVIADIVSGGPSSAGQVLFQYRHSTGSAWFDIPVSGLSETNPDTEYPFAIHWDVTALPTTGFFLRAVASDAGGLPDPLPAAVSIFADPVDWSTEEQAVAGGRIRKRQLLRNSVENNARALDQTKSQVVSLTVPAGALNDSTVTVSIINNPTTTPAPPPGALSIGASVDITLTGQTLLAEGKIATLDISYPDADGNGIVDGTAVRADELRIYSYDPAALSWRQDVPSSVDAASRTVAGRTSHFSIFGLFAPLHSDLDSLLVYPVPFRPNNADLDDGRPYAQGDLHSGIVFDLLPPSASVKIYTLGGQLVVELNTASNGRIQWDVRNQDGRDVASGGYLAVITGGGQTPVVRKLLIIR